MTDQDPELRQLLASARQGFSPSTDDAERVRTRLDSALAAGLDPERPPGSSRGVGWRRLKGLGLIALGLGVGGIGGYALGQRHTRDSAERPPEAAAPVWQAASRPPAPEGAPARDAAPASPSSETTRRTPRPPVRAPSDAGRPARPSSEHRGHDPKAPAPDEVALMQRVNRALARGEAGWALALLRKIELEVPQGRLLEERAAGGAIARCMLEPQSGAEERARYAQLYPSSVHLARISQVCSAAQSNGPTLDPR